MSDIILKLIPENVSYIPSNEAQVEAINLLKSFVGENGRVETLIFKEVEFIDAGGNFENITCPLCNIEIDEKWWANSMDIAYLSRFKNLEVNAPCCNGETTLNNLKYNWAQGFARFVLFSENPNFLDLNENVLEELEQILECKLRLIWAQY